MSRSSASVLPVAVTIVGLATGVTPAAAAGDRTRLVPHDGVLGDAFGRAIDVDDGVVVVGAPFAAPGGRLRAGTAYVFAETADGPRQTRLTDIDARGNDTFGRAVAITGDTIVVGSPYDDSPEFTNAGSASVFVRTATGWTQQAELTAPEAQTDLGFGREVAIDGDTILVTRALLGFCSCGIEYPLPATYVFVRSGTSWTLQATLVLPAEPGDEHQVALAGDTLVIANPAEGTPVGEHVGAAHVFVRRGTTWTEQSRLDDPDPSPDGLFGRSVALGGSTIVVSSWRCLEVESDPPSVTVFANDGSTWTVQRTIVPPSDAHEDYTWWPVDLSGDLLVVGAAYADTPAGANAGQAFVYGRTGTTWARVAFAPSGVPGSGQQQFRILGRG